VEEETSTVDEGAKVLKLTPGRIATEAPINVIG